MEMGYSLVFGTNSTDEIEAMGRGEYTRAVCVEETVHAHN
jgi:hypothetical protein